MRRGDVMTYEYDAADRLTGILTGSVMHSCIIAGLNPLK